MTGTAIARLISQAKIQASAFHLPLDERPFLNWWNRVPVGGEALDIVCAKQSAEKLLLHGLRSTLETAVRRSPTRELMCEYLQYAFGVVQEPNIFVPFALPVWLLWLRDTVIALRVWEQCLADLPTPEIKQHFIDSSWRRGADSIAAGYPQVAMQAWDEACRGLLSDCSRSAMVFRQAAAAFRTATQLAQELNIPPPQCPDRVADADGLNKATDDWRRNALAATCAQLFWETHRDFLHRVRFREQPALSVGRKAYLTVLLNSAVRQGQPSFSECSGITKENNCVRDEVLPNLATPGHTHRHRNKGTR